jgi:16S rRNA (guanine1207-N2)-methyltransferase
MILPLHHGAGCCSTLTPPSQLLERHQTVLSKRHLLFTGDLQDDYCSQFNAHHTRVYTHYYHHARRLVPWLGLDRVHYSLLPERSHVTACDTVLYYWPKNKGEAQLQLFSLLAILPITTDWLLVGELRSGIRHVEQLLSPFGVVTKLDSARRCRLYRFRCIRPPPVDLVNYWGSYDYQGLTIKTLPGIFSRDGIDVGSQLLLEQLPALQGRVLDLGCGTGILGVVAQKRYPTIQLTLCDVQAAALAATQATLAENHLSGKIVASEGFSDLQGSFNVIITNPPFHEGRQLSTQATAAWIREARDYLAPAGRLFLVANAFLPYATLLDQTFGSHQLMAHQSRFKLYQVTKC